MEEWEMTGKTTNYLVSQERKKMSRTLSIEIETLTPLWTAGANFRKMDRLHETGIIGSLRWWYEAMIRGLGGNVKDHESGGCQFDAEAYAKHPELPKRERLQKAGLCDVCQLFGATGWKRRFNMKVGQGEKLFQHEKILLPSGRVHKGPRAGGWLLMPDSVMGKNIPLDFRFTDPEDAEKLKILLSLIERHGTLGAKKASGNGVVRFRLKNNGILAPAPVSAVFPWATSATGNGENSPYPDLRDFFFAKVRFTPPSGEWWFCFPENKNALEKKILGANTRNPLQKQVKKIFHSLIEEGLALASPTLRNWLRYKRGKTLDEGLDNYLFGSTDELDQNTYLSVKKYPPPKNCQKTRGLASKINVSHAYCINPKENLWEFRIWGWLPINKEVMPDGDMRHFLLACLQQELRSSAFIKYISGDWGNHEVADGEWLSYDSRGGFNYLQTLLLEKEGAST